jgi:cytosine/adenosine deaminase-related metal-dependent hydrolase/ubiquinone/menaquinone biosynthesis C-methylase UbiE
MTSTAHIPELPQAESPRAEFALWSKVYDESPNPMLALEERFLSLLLPLVSGLDIVDIGCGTGRWLERFTANGSCKLTGIDSSPEMLDCARRKLGSTAKLFLGNATSLPIGEASADVLLASFVASYVGDLSRFAAEIRRAGRTGAQVYLSDLHPETVALCKWKRAFHAGETRVELNTYSHSLQQIIACFEHAGFKLRTLLEPAFGPAEQEILRSAGKWEALKTAAGLPAIYILQLECPEQWQGTVSVPSEQTPVISLLRARVALDADESINAAVELEHGQVARITTSGRSLTSANLNASSSIDLEGYLLLPGLINAHDHLEFGLYSNLGHGGYANCEEWAVDIQQNQAEAIALHQRLPKATRLWWGGLRNLLCGVTTVCHHNPLQPVLLNEDFPVRVLTTFGWAHSLAMDRDLLAKFRSTPHDSPFVVHAAEGIDNGCAQEIFELDRLGVLDDRTVLVHGLALTQEGIELLNRRCSAVVWCPTSNRFLFGRTHSREAVASMDNVLIGSDSPLTAAGDLLDEVRVAHEEIGVPPRELYRMLLTSPASTLRLNDGQGTIRPCALADMIAMRDKGASPAETVAKMQTADVELVIVGGRVQLASETLFRKLPTKLRSGLEPLELQNRLLWIRAPLSQLFAEAERVLGCDITVGNKQVRHVYPV